MPSSPDLKTNLKTYQIKNQHGLELDLLNFGARVHSLKIPRDNRKLNVVLTYPKLENYLQDEFYIGATVGRFCNRIHGGQIVINSNKYPLPINEVDNSNTLHGGFKGFDKYFWDLVDHSEHHVEFKLFSPHLDQGFPGNLQVRARYSIKDLSVCVEYFAISDQDTAVSLCNHSYFNLNGFSENRQTTISKHSLLLYSDAYLPPDKNKVPNGQVQSISESDFALLNSQTHSKATTIHKTLEIEALQSAGGLDHTFVIDSDKNKLRKVAQLYSQDTNIALDVHTNQLAIHIYSGNYLDSSFAKQAGICFESQGYPDAPNHPNFPSAILKANTEYHSKTTYTLKPNFS